MGGRIELFIPPEQLIDGTICRAFIGGRPGIVSRPRPTIPCCFLAVVTYSGFTKFYIDSGTLEAATMKTGLGSGAVFSGFAAGRDFLWGDRRQRKLVRLGSLGRRQ